MQGLAPVSAIAAFCHFHLDTFRPMLSGLQVVLRGCLNKLYNPGYLGFPLPDSVSGSYRDVCDVQRQVKSMGNPNI